MSVLVRRPRSVLLTAVVVAAVLLPGPVGTAAAADQQPTDHRPVDRQAAPTDRAQDREDGESRADRKAGKKRPTLRELRDESDRIAADMQERTAALERSEAARDEAEAHREAVSAEAVEARVSAVAAHAQLGRFAAAAYRGQQLPLEITVLVSPQGQTSDTLHALATLTHAGEIKTDIATYARQTAERAEALEAAAVAAADRAAAAAYRVEMQINDLVALARENRKALKAEVARLERVALRRLAAECRDRADVAARYPNGLIPAEVLCEIGIGELRLRGDAAVAFKELAAAYEKAHDGPICVTDAYRTLAGQVAVFAEKPELAAVPGSSKHGLGIAVDLCGGIQRSGTPEHAWMQANAPDFGWVHPAWAQVGGSRPEAWHWEYVPEVYELRTEARAARADEPSRKARQANGGGA